MPKVRLLLLLPLALFVTLGFTLQEKSYRADSFAASGRLQEGGSLWVSEVVTFRFNGGPFTLVFRELPQAHTDGIVDITAGVDGQIWPEGTAPGQVEIQPGDPIRVTWHLPPTTDAFQTFELNYRLNGIVRQGQTGDELWWQPIPVSHEYPIDQSQAVISYYQEAVPISPAELLSGQAVIIQEPGQTSLAGGALAPNESFAVKLAFQSGTFIVEPPTWQMREAEQAAQDAAARARWKQLSWIWLGSAIILFLGGCLVLYELWQPYRRQLRTQASTGYEPPADLAPAIAGALRNPAANPHWAHALGTLFDLAGQGYVQIEELPAEKWYQSRDFLAKRLEVAEPAYLRPHEQSLLGLLFTAKSGQPAGEVKMSTMARLVTSSRWRRYSDVLKAEMKADGLIDLGRQKGRRLMMVPGGIMLGLPFLVVLLTFLYDDEFGYWPLALAVTFLLLGIFWLLVGVTLSILSDRAAQLAADYEPFYRYLQAVSRGKKAPGKAEEFVDYLPFAAAYGLLHDWARRFEKAGYEEVPAYFQAAESVGAMGAFVAMTAASSSAGGSAAGAAGAGAAAGAAGGGASGAG